MPPRRHRESPHCPCSLPCRPRRPSGPACLCNMALIPSSSATSRYRPVLKLRLILQLLHTRGSTLGTQAEPSARRPAQCYARPEVPLPQPCHDVQRPGCPPFLIAPSSGVFVNSHGFPPARTRGTDMALLRQTTRRALWAPCRRRRDAAAPNDSRLAGCCFIYGDFERTIHQSVPSKFKWHM